MKFFRSFFIVALATGVIFGIFGGAFYARAAATGPPSVPSAPDRPRSIHEIIDFSRAGPIRLDTSTFRELIEYFKEVNTGRLAEAFRQAFYRMGAWEPYLREIFREEEVPERFIYLAIHGATRDGIDRRAVGRGRFYVRTLSRTGTCAGRWDFRHQNEGNHAPPDWRNRPYGK